MKDEPYYVEARPGFSKSGWTDWYVLKRTKGGGDRDVCRATSERTARLIARALNKEASA